MMGKFRQSAVALMVSLAAASSAFAGWDLWDDFKSVSLDGARVVDYSDSRAITTSEGQSYALFFALVADDRESFDRLADWTEKNLSKGDITKTLPTWLWGALRNGRWGVIDSNNAVDSDMWIAYAFLEAGRLWQDEGYTAKGRAMLALLKREVRMVDSLGSVLLPGRVGFERDGVVKLNPSYYPLFILRRFALEDPFWETVFDGSLRALIRSSPSGIAPDWSRFDARGRLVAPADEDCEIGSYNAIRTYLWAGMMSHEDPARRVLRRQFEPMLEATRAINMPPEKISSVTLKVNGAGPASFGACVLPLLERGKTASFIRTVLAGTPVKRDSYYSNVLTLFGLGFDAGRFAFDRDGRLLLPPAESLPQETSKAEAKAEEKAETELTAKPAEKADAKPAKAEKTEKAEKSDKSDKAEPAVKAEPKAESKTEQKPEPKREAQPALASEAKADVKAEAKAETVPDKPDVKADAKADVKAQGKAEAKPEEKAEEKAEAKSEEKADGKPEAQPQAKPAVPSAEAASAPEGGAK